MYFPKIHTGHVSSVSVIELSGPPDVRIHVRDTGNLFLTLWMWFRLPLSMLGISYRKSLQNCWNEYFSCRRHWLQWPVSVLDISRARNGLRISVWASFADETPSRGRTNSLLKHNILNKTNENQWKSMKFNENQGKSMKINENQWKSIKINEN